MTLLGLEGAVNSAAISAAFAEKVKEQHPDTGGPGTDMTQLKAARDHMRQVVAGENRRCKTCKGSGIVRVKMGATPCAACKGTGDKRGS